MGTQSLPFWGRVTAGWCRGRRHISQRLSCSACSYFSLRLKTSVFSMGKWSRVQIVDFAFDLDPCQHDLNNLQIITFIIYVLNDWSKAQFISVPQLFNCLLNADHSWPRGLMHELSSPLRTLGSWVWIPLKAWISVMCAFILSLCCYVCR
jgi:hypothetical protein